MPPILPETSARYTLLTPRGDTAGTEDLAIAPDGAGWRVMGRLTTTFPETLRVSVEWGLDRDLTTRLLQIASRDGFGGEYELELTVTGNGMLAHRTGPDGPSQVELGWGPRVELDYLSAAFPIVAIARQNLQTGVGRELSAVHIGIENLEPLVLEQRWTEVARGEIEVLTLTTGHSARLSMRPDGLLRTYGKLLRLVEA